MPDPIITQIDDLIKSFGFTHWGWIPLEKPLSLDIYKDWIEKGYHGEMGYMADHYSAKAEPGQIMPQARSALVLSHDYLPHPKPLDRHLKHSRVALYAKGEDYHYWFKDLLNQISGELKELYPEDDFLCFTDSAPIMERDLAYRAGLGWVGKNSCLIHSHRGSLFFIGEIYSSLKVEAQPGLLHPDRCGTCTKCMDICPTQAITSPKVLDAKKCISYLNIEAKSIPSKELRPQMSDWLFGCDLCQTVCPWNGKAFGRELMAELTVKENETTPGLIDDLRWILTTSNKQIQKTFKGTALSRTSGNNLKRNALVVIGNQKLEELKPEVLGFYDHERLGELARWAGDQLANSHN